MHDRFNILINISDITLKEKLIRRITEDWTGQWNILTEDNAELSPEKVEALITDCLPDRTLLPPKVSIIFIGSTSEADSFFAVIEDRDDEAVFRALSRAKSFKEITEQNIEAQYSAPEGSESLETVAHTLSARIHQLVKQSEMRIALIDQLPVGVIGIDDEDIIVLANPKAIEVMSIEDMPVWGLPACSLFPLEIKDFIKDKNSLEMTIERYGDNIKVRKATFTLDKQIAGTILVIWKELQR